MGESIDFIYIIVRLEYIVPQGYAGLRVLLRPPITPPYLLILFSAIHVLAALVDSVSYAVEINVDVKALALNILRMTLPMLFIWVAGTLPLQCIRPARYVAGPKDVRLN
jgi:hypothetical protein